jgi:anti-sigma factor RsiW
LAELGVEGHPSEDQLLLTLEGEVAGAEAERVQQHLAGCWNCKARYEEMQRGILAFVEYREKRYLPAVESPSSDSSGFRARLRTMAQEAPSVPPAVKIWRKLAVLWHPFQHIQLRWVSAVAAAMVALLLWTEVISPPPVSASELLTRAMAAQKPPAAGRNRMVRQTVQIRSGERVVTRNFEWNTNAPIRQARWDVQADPLAWDAPLTAQAFSDWRDGLSTKTDKVKRSGDRLVLDTLAPADPIREARISVRAADFHPVAQHISFYDGHELDLTEIAFQIEEETAAPVAIAQSAPPKAAATQAVPKPDLDQAEIDLRYILFAHRWDLGEDLIVERNTSDVTLSGIVSSPERKQAIQEAVNGMANVRLKLTLPTALNAPAENDTTIRQDARDKSVPLLHDTFDRSFSSPDEKQAFIDRCLVASDDALAHAWALKRLADRYSDQNGQAKLQEMVRAHLQELGRANNNLDPLGKLLRTPGAAAPVIPSNWRDQVIALFAAVEQQDRDVTDLVAASQTNERNLSQVSAEFRFRHQAIHALLDSLK